METRTGAKCRGVVLALACMAVSCSSDCGTTGEPLEDTGAKDGVSVLDRQVSLDQADQAVDTTAVPDLEASELMVTPDQKVDQKVTPDQKVAQKVAPDQQLPPAQKLPPAQAVPDQKVTPDQKIALDKGPAKVPGNWKTIPAGKFKMGAPLTDKCRDKNEPAPVPVTLTRSFEIQTTEVTQAQFMTVMAYNPSAFGACGGACPVEYINWHEAVAYCNALSSLAKLPQCYACTGSGKSITCKEATASLGKGVYSCKGYRLPTEAEWEYAYRAGTSSALYNGPITNCTGKDASVDKIAWYHENSGKKTHPVAKKLANAWGLYDLAGNVEEWCHDPFQNKLWTTAQTDPVGSGPATHRALRSGSIHGFAYLMRGSARYGQPLATRANNIGLRCVRTMP